MQARMSCCVRAALLWLLLTSPLSAQDSPFRALAEHLTARGPYRGPTVALGTEHARPAESDVRWCSLERPLCVHGHAGADRARAPQVLAALERAYDWLLARDWPLPYPDGGAGDTLAFDLYLTTAVPAGASAYPEQLATATPLDAATAFALLDRDLPDDELPQCTLVALAEAGLLGRDPAEAPQLRRASAAVASWLAEGALGCELDPERAQRQVRLGAVGDADEQVASAALWLAWLDRRHQRSSGELVRELWELAAQRSDGPSKLHARPNVWEALEQVLQRAGESLDADAAELALQRAIAPAALGVSARDSTPLLATFMWSSLPSAVSSRDPLASYGSAYVRVETPAPRPGSQLRIWLRADPDARWSLQAARFDDHAHSLGTLSAPPRNLPESYLPIELTPDTRTILIVITALPPRPTPLPTPPLDEHHFRLTLAPSP